MNHNARQLISATLLSAAIAALGMGTVSAQTPPPAAQAKPAPRMMERPFTKPTERVEAQLAYQKTALKITGTQEPQWNAYANHVRKQAADMEQRFTQMRDQRAQSAKGAQPQRTPRQRPNAVERLEQQQARLAEASRRLNERLAVQKPLYASLSPEQQQVADVVLNARGGRDGHRGKGGRDGRGDRHMHVGGGFARG